MPVITVSQHQQQPGQPLPSSSSGSAVINTKGQSPHHHTGLAQQTGSTKWGFNNNNK